VTGDFSNEKQHVMDKMRQRLCELRKDDILWPSMRESMIKIGVTSVFRYSAGVVPWTKQELEAVSRLWIQAYKQGWKLPPGTDATAFILNEDDGGRGCPSAEEMWIRDTLDLLDQCICLPGEISQIVIYQLQLQFV